MKEKSGLVIKSYTLYDPNKKVLKFHSFKFNEQQNKSINNVIKKYRKNNGFRLIDWLYSISMLICDWKSCELRSLCRFSVNRLFTFTWASSRSSKQDKFVYFFNYIVNSFKTCLVFT